MTPTSARHDLVLAGGGHTHALALRMFIMQPPPDTRITLVSPEALTPYSGMLPGLVAGHYGPDDLHIDLVKLCQATGARFIRARVEKIDADQNLLRLSDGSELEYDWLSLDVGSTPDLDSVPGAREHAIPVKPVSNFHGRWRAFLDDLVERPEAIRSLAVVGGGAGGTELILAMAHALHRRNLRLDLHLITAQSLLPGYPARVQRTMREALAEFSVTLHENAPVKAVEKDAVQLPEHDLACDALFWCTGARGPAWARDSALALSERDFIRVDETLRSISHKNVFAAGDCAWQDPSPAPRAGVYAVRQAPVLAANLRAAVAGKPLQRYRPQRKFLSLLSAGDRFAVGSRNGFGFGGRWVWRWKDHIDRKFMRRFDEDLPARKMAAPVDEDAMRCQGCGAKVGSDALRGALDTLPVVRHDNILSGLAEREDASVVRWPEEQLLVQSQDYFPAFIDDPLLFGRLAALHSLSDVHARNARAHSALATISLPVNHPRLQGRDLKRLMHGAAMELQKAGCALLGGHTVEGPQLAAGFTVNGAGRPDQLLGKGGARPGDLLMLTKPIGTGVILAAVMHGLRAGRALEGALEWMLQANSNPAALFHQHGAKAATDITGFGLLGHLLEMLDASGVGAVIEAATVPALPGAQSLVRQGIVSTLKPANDIALTRCDVDRALVDHPLLTLFTDPQTCGGLLAAVPPERADACRKSFREQELELWMIGHVVERHVDTNVVEVRH